MDRGEAQRRDRVIRAFFAGKDWDLNAEFRLKRSLVGRSAELLPAFPYVVDDEWDVVAGYTNHGRGDLVFTDGVGNFAVVEVKFIDLEATGRTARAKRTKSRGLVREQAIKYARVVARRLTGMGFVMALAYNNEAPDALVEVGRVDGSADEE